MVGVNLPARFGDTGNLSAVCKFAEAYPAEIKIPQISALAPATKTAAYDAGLVFGRLQRPCND